MRNLLIPMILFGLAQACWSHPGGDHQHVQKERRPITDTEAQRVAKGLVAIKVSKDKISDSWLKISPKKAYKKKTERGEEWIVEFHDPKAPKGRTKIYIFMGLTGDVSVFKLTGG